MKKGFRFWNKITGWAVFIISALFFLLTIEPTASFWDCGEFLATANKLQVGLQQLMAGARCFNISAISRNELMSLTEECADVTGIPYLMDCYRDEAIAVLLK